MPPRRDASDPYWTLNRSHLDRSIWIPTAGQDDDPTLDPPHLNPGRLKDVQRWCESQMVGAGLTLWWMRPRRDLILMVDPPSVEQYHSPIPPGEAAAILGRHPNSIRVLIEAGRLETWRMPSGYQRVLPESLEAYIEASAVRP